MFFVIPVKTGIQILFVNKEEGLDSRFHGNDMGKVILSLFIKLYGMMLTMQRSVISFLAIIIFGTGAAIFVVKKGNDAADEIERLNEEVFSVHRAAFVQLSDDVSKNGIIDTSNWKIYRNEKYGFEFRYPGDITVIFNKETDTLRVYDSTYDVTDKLGAGIRA